MATLPCQMPFSAATVKTIPGWVSLLFKLYKLMFKSLCVFSEEGLPLIKPVWSGCMNDDITGSNLMATAFAHYFDIGINVVGQ